MDQESTALMPVVESGPEEIILRPVQSVEQAKARLQEFQAFVQGYLQPSTEGGADGGDYGTIPGAGPKKVLFKSGADKLCDIYGLADKYSIESRVEEWDTGLFDYVVTCELRRRRDEVLVGSGMGSCSSYEAKYRWRKAERTCPKCGKTSIIKGKAEFGGGWVCWTNKGGCGAKFDDKDPAIVGQNLDRVENPDLADTKNTVLKMAQKRAKIQAVISVTRSSGIFTQDLEDLSHIEPNVPLAGETPKPIPVQPVARPVTRPTPVERPVQKDNGGSMPHPMVPPQAVAQPEVLPPVSKVGEPVLVQMLEPKTGTSKNGPWKLYPCKFTPKVRAANGELTSTGGTFNEGIAAQLIEAEARQMKVLITAVKTPKGSYEVKAVDYPAVQA